VKWIAISGCAIAGLGLAFLIFLRTTPPQLNSRTAQPVAYMEPGDPAWLFGPVGTKAENRKYAHQTCAEQSVRALARELRKEGFPTKPKVKSVSTSYRKWANGAGGIYSGCLDGFANPD
jgi:hypothetical protein